MIELRLSTADGRTAFEPFEEVDVVAEWDSATPPPWLELRLTWFTRGKGNTDLLVVRHWRHVPTESRGKHVWHVRLPAAPYSFSGKYVSLVWTLELLEATEEHSTRRDIIIAPLSREIALHPVAPVESEAIHESPG